MHISGWGNNFKKKSNIHYPKNISQIIHIIKKNNIKNFITRGEGRSYGDQALNKDILSLKYINKKVSLDERTGLLKCSSNITIEKILPVIIPKGWFLGVTPGSKYISIGGLIANDVHGKNHHKDGSFSNYIKDIKLIDQNGKIKICSENKNSSLFRSTCGGAGLTGVIIEAKIQLIKINSNYLDVKIFKKKNLKETINFFNKIENYKYSVGWVDTCSEKNFGRSIIYCADHSNDKKLDYKIKNSFGLPAFFVKFFMNNFFLKIFNWLYYISSSDIRIIKKDINSFFYPLDRIKNWNKFYGKKGFTQIQFLIRNKKNYYNVSNKIFNFLRKKKIYSFLTTIKLYGKKNKNYLSFCEKGLSITMDIPISNFTKEKYLDLEKLLFKNNVKLYLAKDSFMSSTHFKKTYKEFKIFKKKLNIFNSKLIFKSNLSERLKIT
jgi:decaprenylphospho-beta-D-ribofuranose 2-oxidase